MPNVFLDKELLEAVKKAAIELEISPSNVIRSWISWPLVKVGKPSPFDFKEMEIGESRKYEVGAINLSSFWNALRYAHKTTGAVYYTQQKGLFIYIIRNK